MLRRPDAAYVSTDTLRELSRDKAKYPLNDAPNKPQIFQNMSTGSRPCQDIGSSGAVHQMTKRQFYLGRRRRDLPRSRYGSRKLESWHSVEPANHSWGGVNGYVRTEPGHQNQVDARPWAVVQRPGRWGSANATRLRALEERLELANHLPFDVVEAGLK